MSVSNNEQLYDLVRRLIQDLRTGGHDQAASDLEDALSISTLPGEILEEIRYHLQNLRSSTPVLDPNLRPPVKEALNYLASILGRQ